ncbi:hypothetical protein PPERSA_01573 [Pseudocohnilembus persalinus]|uniref:Protein DPCD n=1 Tax=Pseudocohnilembus persalinus TaxID=266149 RepID=A0A0V0QHJ6_PSEPJ|nr:hypothetical protein PPERSA_01573 [Pseudocohnilembus persalinus]|eukprot:KRX01703.1 hypothetical protein PPERSA_01573 [Pseudocohnilembus persalinus]
MIICQQKEKKGVDFTGKCSITSVIAGGRRRLNYNFDDKSEMVEEYDIKSHEILCRRNRKPQSFKEVSWNYEIGEAPQKDVSEQLLIKTNNNPQFIRKDTARDFQFRIRNLQWPEEVYQIEVDEEKQQIIIKTTVKKYYKRFEIPDLIRQGIKLDKSKISKSFKNNTLLISYPKPDPILMREQQMRNEFDKLNKKNPREGEIECVTQ